MPCIAAATRHDDEVEPLTGVGGKDDRLPVGRPRRIALDVGRLRPQSLAVSAIGCGEPDAIEVGERETPSVRRPRRLARPARLRGLSPARLRA
jgi:hypothetical protein